MRIAPICLPQDGDRTMWRLERGWHEKERPAGHLEESWQEAGTPRGRR